jgi:hypothetical protein
MLDFRTTIPSRCSPANGLGRHPALAENPSDRLLQLAPMNKADAVNSWHGEL